MKKIAIIGFGCAGYHGAKALRESGCDEAIEVFTENAHTPANPMLTTYYTAGRIPYEALFPFGSLKNVARRLALNVHSDSQVVSLNARERHIALADGSAHVFDQLLIATGAIPVVPPLGQYPARSVFVMRTVKDAQLLKARLEEGGVNSAVVVGASMTGVKVIELLHEQGITCTLVDAASQIFPLSALPEIAHEIQRRLMDKGVQQLYGERLCRLAEEQGQLAVELQHTRMLCDIAVVCIGVRPRLDFLNADQIALSRGILVDSRMRTSVSGIYAAGDCCAGTNLQTGEKQIIGLWANAGFQGRTAGRNMAGIPEEYPGEIPHNATHFMGMSFTGMGDVSAAGEPLEYTAPDGSFRLLATRRNGRPVCVNILDRSEVSGVVKSCLARWFASRQSAFTPAQCIVMRKSGIPTQIIEELGGVV